MVLILIISNFWVGYNALGSKILCKTLLKDVKEKLNKNQSLILIIGIKLNACWFVVNGLISLTNLCWYIVCIKRKKFFKKIVDKSEKKILDEYILHEVINIKAYSWSKCPKWWSTKKRLQKTILEFYYIYYFMITMDWCMIITITMSC